MAQATLAMQGAVAVVTIDNGPQNRLSIEMLDELSTIFRAIEDSDARAAIVRAVGENFSFGGDIVPWVDMSSIQLRRLFERYMRTLNHFEQLRIPTIAAAQGRCFGGGFELALRADMIFAAETATFGHPEQSLAIVTILGGIYRVAERAGRAKAMEWACTSEPVPADVMAQHGVINRVVPDAELPDAVMAFAEALARGPTKAHAAHKSLLRIFAQTGTAVADDAMFDIAMPLFESSDVKTALPASVKAFIEQKPRPAFPFSGN